MIEWILEELENPDHAEMLLGADWEALRGCLVFFRDSIKHDATGEEAHAEDDEAEEEEEEEEEAGPEAMIANENSDDVD